MKKKGLLAVIVGICLVLTVTFFICGAVPAKAATTLKVGTGPVGGNWFPLGAVVATIINENMEGVRAAPTLGGGGTNLKALNRGTQDLSLTIATTNASAWAGKPPFKKKYRDNTDGENKSTGYKPFGKKKKATGGNTDQKQDRPNSSGKKKPFKKFTKRKTAKPFNKRTRD